MRDQPAVAECDRDDPPNARGADNDTKDHSAPRPNTAALVFDQRCRVLGQAGERLVICGASPPHALFLIADEAGVMGLMTIEKWHQLVQARQIRITGPDLYRPIGWTEKMMAQCALLDDAAVNNGTKSISVWLHRNWSAELMDRYGKPNSPHSIRRWRARMSRPPF